MKSMMAKKVLVVFFCLLGYAAPTLGQNPSIKWIDWGGYNATRISSVAFSSDGTELAMGLGREIALWDCRGDSIKKVLAYVRKPVVSVCFAWGDSIIIAGYGNIVKIWNARSYLPLDSIVERDVINEMHVSRDGRFLLTETGSPSNRHTARIWNLRRRILIKDFTSYQCEINSADISPNGRFLVLGTGWASDGIGNSTIIWSVEKNKIVSLHRHPDEISRVMFSPDGKYYASGAEYRDYPAWETTDTVLRVWKFDNDSLVYGFTQFESSVASIAFSPNDAFVLSAAGDGYASLKDLRNNSNPVDLKSTVPIAGPVAFSPDGKYLFTAANGTKGIIWSLDSLKIRKTLDPGLAKGDDASIWRVIFSPNGSFVVTADNSDSAIICVWNSFNGRKLWELNAVFSGGDNLAISNNGRYLAYGNRRIVKVWDVSTHKLVSTLKGHKKTKFFYQTDITGIEFLPDDKRILSSSIDNDVRLWDIKTGRCLSIYHNPDESFLGVKSILLENNRNTIIAGYCGYILGWDLSADKIKYRLEDDSTRMQCVDKLFELNDGRILSASTDEQKTNCRIWNLRTRKVIRRFYIEFNLDAMDVSPNKKYIATASSEDHPASLEIWDLSTGSLLHVLHAKVSMINAIAWSPDGRKIVTGSVDGTLIMWNVPEK